jgi:DNA (cytosine-5)-methyltransferase 1
MPDSDIRNLDPTMLEDFDILCGGFPCQSFSNGGKKKAFDDDRGLLFDEIMRIVKVKSPKFLFLENVKHILKVDEGKVFEYILDKLDKYGYNVEWKKMSPHEYGVPQQRERIYFVCVRKDLYKEPIKLIYQKVPDIDVKLFLDNKEDIDKKYFIKGDLLECLNAWDKIIKKFEVGEKISPTIMANDFNTKIDDNDFKKLPNWKQEYIRKNRPLYIKYKTEWDDWVKENIPILDKRKIYSQLDWQTGPIVKNDSIFNHFMQIRQSGIRVKKSKYFPTLVAISQIPIYGKEKRYITPRECARIQSFPDDFILDTDDKVSYKQLGNSVNVDNVRNIVESTLSIYGLM